MAFKPRRFGIAKPTPHNLQQTLNEVVMAFDELAGVGDVAQRAVRLGELIEIGLLGTDERGRVIAGTPISVTSVSSGETIDTTAFVKKAGDIMSGPLTVAEDWQSAQAQSMGLHVKSGTMTMGSFAPGHFYWYNTYANNSYLTMDKLTADNDASIVFTEAGRARWEFGATTQPIGDPARLHLKRVLTPTANQADDQFLDVLTVEYPSGNIWVNRGYQLWVGALPTVPDIMFAVTETFDAPDRRVTMMIENWNAIPGSASRAPGSQSSTLLLGGVDTKWSIGNDVGMDGGHNFYIQDENAASESFRLYADIYGVAINGTYLNPTEAFRINSKAGSAQGFLPPSLTQAVRNTMGAKENGLLINNTSINALQRWNGTAWETLGVGGTGGVSTSVVNNWTAKQIFDDGLQIATGGLFEPGMLYADSDLGLVIGTITGTTYDMQLCTPEGDPLLTIPTGTNQLLAWGEVVAINEIRVDRNGLAATARLAATCDAGQIADVQLRTLGVDRWSIRKSNAGESGGNAGSNFALIRHADDGSVLGNAFFVTRSTGVVNFETTPLVGGATMWHGGNDGAGSGLDADTLDGEHGTFYRDASNLNTGTLGDARLLDRLKAQPGSMTADWNNYDEAGFYHAPSGLVNDPFAGTNDWAVSTWRGVNSNNVVQLAVRTNFSGSPMFKMRIKSAGTWQAWNDVWTSASDGAGSGLDADTVDGLHPITDPTSNSLAMRDSAADITARTLRSSLANEVTPSGALAFRRNNGADNYLRYCSIPSEIRSFLEANEGFYAPTLTSVANVGSSSAVETRWQRSGAIVFVSGRITVTPSAAATLTGILISLPIASAMTSSAHLSGVAGINQGTNFVPGNVIGDVTADAALLQFISASTGAHNTFFHFSYRIIP